MSLITEIRAIFSSKVITNMSWLLFDNFIRVAAGLIVFIVIARHFGPELFGVYSWVMALISLFLAFAGLGLREIIVRDLVKSIDGHPSLLSTAIAMKLFFGIGLYFLLLVLIKALREDDEKFLFLGAILGTTLLIRFCDVSAFWYEHKVEFKNIAIIQSLTLLISCLIKISVVLSGGGIFLFSILSAVEALIIGILSFYLLMMRGPPISFRFVRSSKAKYLLHECWPMFFGAIAVTVYMRIDQIMLGQMLSMQDVGSYSIAVKITEMWNFVGVALITSVFPLFIKLRETDSDEYTKGIQMMMEIVVILGLLSGVCVLLFGDFFIENLFGNKFISSYETLKINIWGSIFVFLGVVSGKWLVAEGLQIFSLYRALVGASINVILNIFLIPTFGVQGAAFATLAAFSVSGLIFDFFVGPMRKIGFMKLQCFNPFFLARHLRRV